MGITSLMVALNYFNIYDDKVGLVIIDYEMYQMDCDLANNIAERLKNIFIEWKPQNLDSWRNFCR